MAGNGEVRRAPRGAVAEQGAPVRFAAAVLALALSRLIKNERATLDQIPIKS